MRNYLMFGAALAALASAPALAGEGLFAPKSDGDWMIRLRGIAVTPQDDSDLTVSGTALDHSIDTSIVPELDITYFFTPNIAAELILATAPHEISVSGPVNSKLTEVWLLPPTLTLQYHVTEFGAFKPYLGAGVNYTIFYNIDEEPGFDVEIDDTFGLALQAGFDYEIADGYYLNADVKKIWLSPDVNVNNGAVTGEAGINPWIFGLGAGYRF